MLCDYLFTGTFVGLNETERKIRSFSKLKAGWRLGGGQPFSQAVLDTASEINAHAVQAGFLQTDAFPGKNGEVSVVIYNDGNRYDFRVRTASILFMHECNNEDVDEQDHLKLDAALKIIQCITKDTWTQKTCTLFFTYTSPILSQHLEDFALKPLRNPATELESLLSSKIVSLRELDPYACMDQTSIQQSPPSQFYFGNLTRNSYFPMHPLFHVQVIPETFAMRTWVSPKRNPNRFSEKFLPPHL
jgi:hypothetical protein